MWHYWPVAQYKSPVALSIDNPLRWGKPVVHHRAISSFDILFIYLNATLLHPLLASAHINEQVLCHGDFLKEAIWQERGHCSKPFSHIPTHLPPRSLVSWFLMVRHYSTVRRDNACEVACCSGVSVHVYIRLQSVHAECACFVVFFQSQKTSFLGSALIWMWTLFVWNRMGLKNQRSQQALIVAGFDNPTKSHQSYSVNGI